jgi:transcriptional regulator with XRE-family HTH domain
MSKPIEGSIVKRVRTLRGLTQDQLAEKAKLTKDTISRLERGMQSGAGRAGVAVAKALGVELGVLTGDVPMPTGSDEDTPGWRTYPLAARVDGVVRNAYTLTAARYGVTIATIVDVAPLLFVLAAERSLARRRQHMAELDAATDRVSELCGQFPHLPPAFMPSVAWSDHLIAEEESIRARDILAEKLEHERILSKDYEQAEQNPFVTSLREEILDKGDAKIDHMLLNDVDYWVCLRDAKNLADGDVEIAEGILRGWVPLHEMPSALWKDAAKADRLTWLREKRAEGKQAHEKLLEDLLGPFNLVDLAEGAAS